MNWHTETRMNCTAIVDESGKEVVFIDIEPRFFDGVPCGSVTSQGRTAEELKEITNLIAAAPELLGLAEMVAAGNTETKYLELLAAQVIALAKGEGR